ncbi:MAG: hypothetical protein QGI05_01585 [Candidatus Omnitrophota bacterium]|jgi:HD-like signal output (HDOD) protein|nr:hypothetical protein [Candidatus Omnitrophota bacterium]
MMTELWWKAFLTAIIIIVIAKALGCTWGIAKIFFVGFLGSIIGIILLILISNFIWELWKARREKRGRGNAKR